MPFPSEILRYFVQILRFQLLIRKTENFMRKRRISPNPFFAVYKKTEYLNDKTENFLTQLVRSTE